MSSSKNLGLRILFNVENYINYVYVTFTKTYKKKKKHKHAVIPKMGMVTNF